MKEEIKYSKSDIIKAITDELMDSYGGTFKAKKRLTSADYTTLGIVNQAFKRLKL